MDCLLCCFIIYEGKHKEHAWLDCPLCYFIIYEGKNKEHVWLDCLLCCFIIYEGKNKKHVWLDCLLCCFIVYDGKNKEHVWLDCLLCCFIIYEWVVQTVYTVSVHVTYCVSLEIAGNIIIPSFGVLLCNRKTEELPTLTINYYILKLKPP